VFIHPEHDPSARRRRGRQGPSVRGYERRADERKRGGDGGVAKVSRVETEEGGSGYGEVFFEQVAQPCQVKSGHRRDVPPEARCSLRVIGEGKGKWRLI
jgi:hypothetical protein